MTSAKNTAFVFPGQGSQKVGMGKYLAETFQECRDVFEEVNDAVGKDLSKIMFEGSEDDLNLTENTQPAIMANSIAVWRMLEKEVELPAYCSLLAGHSLGEYSALCAAGCFSLSDTALLLQIRGKAMQQAVPVGEGSMAALIGLNFDDVIEIAEESGCDLANDNAPGQVVISGAKAAVEKGIEIAKAKGAKRAIELPVSAPFHCKLMQPAADVMKQALGSITINDPSVPFVANITAKPVTKGSEVADLLVQQVTGMVRWRESITYMNKVGINLHVELGNGKVLAGLAKRIAPDMKTLNLTAPHEIEEYLNQ